MQEIQLSTWESATGWGPRGALPIPPEPQALEATSGPGDWFISDPVPG